MCGAAGNSSEPKRIVLPRLARSEVLEMEAIRSPGQWTHDVLPTVGFQKWPAAKFIRIVSRFVIGCGLVHNDSRSILVQSIVLYVQPGVSRMYHLSPGAYESWGVTSIRAGAMRFESLWVRSIERLTPFPRWMTLPFIVQGASITVELRV
jgi:hypothetical protein